MLRVIVHDARMDKAAIYTEIMRRNALRREAGLPALDVTAEYRHAVAQAERAEFQAICDRHRDLWDEMLTTVTQELRAKRDNPSFGNCMGSRIMIRVIARERFYATLELQGYRKPFSETRNTIPYGKNRKG
jgi:hypothetical protein